MAERWPAGRCATARLLVVVFAWLLMAIDVRADPGSATAGVPVIEEKLARAVTHLREAGMAEALAAHVTTSGHWRIANTKGEVMTAAGANELKRVLGILAPGAPARTSAPNIVLTTGAAAQTAREAQAWPAGVRLSLLAGKAVLPLRIELLEGQERLVAEIRPSLLLQISGVAEIEEALWQMDRPVTADAVRLLSLDTGGSRTIRARAARDPASKAPLADAVDPYGLVKALPALKGQKVLVVGRLDKELLWYQPRTGAEQSILAGDLRSAAADNDIALVILDTRLPRQPGERTWAFLKVEVPGLGEAMRAGTMADFYAALGTAHGRLALRVVELTSQRVRMEAVPIKTAWGRLAGERGVGGALQDVVTGLTGNLAPLGVRMELPSRARQEELSRRWILGVPSAVQLTYGLLLALGLAAWPIASRWWAWLWPAESRQDYRLRAGYVAARGVRWLLLVAVFVPAVAVVAFPVAVVTRLWETAHLVALSVGRGRRPASGTAGKNAGAGP